MMHIQVEHNKMLSYRREIALSSTNVI